MSPLSIFPIEILEWITSVVPTTQQMRLWQCGDRTLNIKLKNGGLKRTSLSWSGSSWMPWPKSYFTTFDGLVDVSWAMDIGASTCPTLELNLLPTTLKRLYLACKDVFILLRQQSVNMNEILPTLHTLHLSGMSIREENLKNLPSNLIELQVTSGEIKSATIFRDLPRHIERLTLSFHIVDLSEHENDLPTHLVSLNISSIECDFNWFSKLPKSLKMLTLDYASFDCDWRTLPSQLEALDLGTVDVKSIPQLPQSLKTLQVSRIRDLTRNDELVPLLPKNLTRFALVSGKVGPSALQQLPPSLTDFDVDVSAKHPDMISFYRPETSKIRITGDSGKLNLFPFPTKLQILKIDHINDDLCATLPPGLHKLEIAEGGIITIKGASKLPKSLKSLTARFEMFDDNQTMSCLRHISVLELSTRRDDAFGNLNENWITSLLSSPTSSNNGIISEVINVNDINRDLTSLTVEIVGSRKKANTCHLIKKPFFDALPKFANLNRLKISGVPDISSEVLCLIPQNVTELAIGHLTASPTANQLSTLPKCLRYLYLDISRKVFKECEWNDETLQLLPRTLQNFTINRSLPNLTQRMHEYLPPNACLRYWADKSGSNSVFFYPMDRLYANP